MNKTTANAVKVTAPLHPIKPRRRDIKPTAIANWPTTADNYKR